ncbi:MAG: outer membrane lipoprotein chaperone LolA [Congregibacter sp.]
MFCRSIGFKNLFRLAACILVLGISPCGAQEPDLWQALEGQTQAHGSFEQELYDEKFQLVERSKGRYSVLRPRYFRWSITDPDRQEIVLREEQLWHYDVDLASATVRPADDGGMFTPLELLGGNAKSLRDRFSVEQIDDQSFRLTPSFPQAGFASVDVTWADGEIVGMRIADRSGQQIVLSLTPDANAAPLAPGDFELELPADVELHDMLTR